MPINVTWANQEQDIVFLDYEGRWTWDEYFNAMKQLGQFIASVNHRVDAIANMKPGIMPTSGSAMTAARTTLRGLPPNRGVIVIVTNPLIGAMLTIFRQFDRDMGNLLRAANSVEEGYTIIQQERQKTTLN